MIGEGTDYPLRGILSVPDNTAGKVPAVVLVHGSGAHDMDETIYENKPFRDIADYLASNGVAVMRYNKRTLTYGGKWAGDWTIKEETIQDAIFAAKILKSDPRIDGNRVFIIGHSLGGMLAPRIHSEGGDFAGIISLAGSPRFLLDISKDQNYAIIKAIQNGEKKEQALKEMEQWDDYYAGFLNLPDSEAKNTSVPGWNGISAYYLKDLYNNPVSKYVKDLNIPVLIMQGEKDTQVYANKDFTEWQNLLAGKENITFKLYEGLNHLFMRSVTYMIKDNVDAQVLADITDFVKSN